MEDRNRRRSALLWVSCALALLLVIAKAASSSTPWLPGFPARVLTLIASSWSDVLFAIAAAGAGEIALLCVQRWKRAAAFVWVFFVALFAVFAAYGVAAVGLFRYFHRPLTYDLLGLIGNATTVRSSIADRVTPLVGLALVAAPGLIIAVAVRARRSRRREVVAVVLAGAWITCGWSLSRSSWAQEELEYLRLSPHAEFLRTTAVRLAGGRRPAFPKDFPPDYLEEFRTFGARRPAVVQQFQPAPGVARPRNVIVIVLESVGTKYLGLYGSANDAAPNLSAESRHALVFDNIYAHASFTYASFRPVNFSVYPGLPWHYALLEDARPLPKTLASVMRERGSRTAYFTSGDLDWGDQRWLLERGGDFDAIEGAADLGCPLLSSWGTEDRCAFDRMISWIDRQPQNPFFAVCWTDQTHDPFILSPRVSSRAADATGNEPKFANDLARYLTNLRQVDAQLGRLFAALRERGLADDTLVVVTGDHGEAFADPHQQRGHAWSVFDEEVRVPLLLWNPRLFPEPARAAAVGGHINLNATIADIVGVAPPNEWQGYSLFDPARPERAYFMAIAGGDVFGVRAGQWKYIFDVTSGRELLFDLDADPREQQNVAAAQPARCLELRRRLAAWVTFEEAYLWGREN